jgi:hypothetical protein
MWRISPHRDEGDNEDKRKVGCDKMKMETSADRKD